MNLPTKKLIVLGIIGIIFVVTAIIFFVFKSNSYQPASDKFQSVKAPLPISGAVTLPGSNSVSFFGKVKGLGFDQFPALSLPFPLISQPNLSNFPNIFDHSYLLPLARKNLLPPSKERADSLIVKSRKITALSQQNTMVFPDFYLSYLYQIQDSMLADSFISEKKIFKTNEEVVAFLDQTVDYLIKNGALSASERDKLRAGIREDLKLLKQERAAGQPQSYYPPDFRRLFGKILDIAPAYAQIECFRAGSITPAQRFVENFCPEGSEKTAFFINSPTFKKIISLLMKFVSARGAKAQIVGGSNLWAPCCSCYAGKVPIGCLNAVCPAGAAIWDPASGICGCGGGGGAGGGASVSAPPAPPAPPTEGSGVSTSFNIGSNAGILGNASLSPEGQNFEFYNSSGELAGTLPSNNVSNMNFDVLNTNGSVAYSIAANQYGFNIYDPNGSLVNTVIPDNFYNSFNIYNAQDNLTSIVPNQAELANKLISPQEPGLLGAGLGGEVGTINDIQPPPEFSEVASSKIPNVYFDNKLGSSEANIIDSAIASAKDKFNGQMFDTDKLTIVVMDKETFAKTMLGSALENPDALKKDLENSGYSPNDPMTQKDLDYTTNLMKDNFAAFAKPEDKPTVLFLNENVFTKDLSASNISVPKNASEVMVHELGHPAFDNLSSDIKSNFIANFQESKGCGCGQPSLYAYKDVGESFSENITAYVKSGGNVNPWLKGQSSQSQAIIKKSFDLIKNSGLIK